DDALVLIGIIRRRLRLPADVAVTLGDGVTTRRPLLAHHPEARRLLPRDRHDLRRFAEPALGQPPVGLEHVSDARVVRQRHDDEAPLLRGDPPLLGRGEATGDGVLLRTEWQVNDALHRKRPTRREGEKELHDDRPGRRLFLDVLLQAMALAQLSAGVALLEEPRRVRRSRPVAPSGIGALMSWFRPSLSGFRRILGAGPCRIAHTSIL